MRAGRFKGDPARPISTLPEGDGAVGRGGFLRAKSETWADFPVIVEYFRKPVKKNLQKTCSFSIRRSDGYCQVK
jgi:hypothetical protein